MAKILENGIVKEDRTGIGTKSLFGQTMRFDLSGNTIPVLTTKKVFWKGIVLELLWFLKGDTDSKILEQYDVNIWRGNTSSKFISSRHILR